MEINKFIKFFMMAFALLWANMSFAQTGQTFVENGIYYKVISEYGQRVAVTCQHDNNSLPIVSYSGNVTIPSYVYHNNVSYYVQYIDNQAFYNCTGLTSVTIPNTVESIGSNAFQYSGISTITIPASVAYIGDYAFDGCSNLAMVINKNTTPQRLGTNAFGTSVSGITLVVPDPSSLLSYKAADVWKDFNAMSSIVKHETSEPTISERGFASVCWEQDGKYYSEEACTNELKGADLAQTVRYAKFYTSPVGNMSGFTASESENDWTVQLNWTAVTTFANASSSSFDRTARYAEFRVKDEHVGYPRLVWVKDQGDSHQGKFTVTIYVNDEVKYTVNQNDGKFLEGVFVLPLPDVKYNDVIKFEVKQDEKAAWGTASPTFKASLEYTITECVHTYPVGEGSAVCEKCGEVAEHDHSYDPSSHMCTLCGSMDTDYQGYVGYPNRKDIMWTLTENNDGTYTLTFTGSGDMEIFNSDHAPWRKSSSPSYQKIKKIVVGEGITNIGYNSLYGGYFESMRKLTEVSLPSTLTKVGSRAFSCCSSLKTIALPESVTTIGIEAFSESGLESITLPSGLQNIRHGAFVGCYSLSSITIPSGIKVIEKETFWDCTSLRSVTLPEGLTSIRDYAFCRVPAENLILPSTLRVVGEYALDGTSDFYLTSSVIPDRSDYVYEVIPVEGTLHVNNALLDWAKDTTPWNMFSNIVPLYNIDYTDAEGVLHTQDFDLEANDNTFTLPVGIRSLNIYENIPMQTLTYTRTFSNTDVWQCWYMPFEVEVDETRFKAAEIAGILFDSERNAVVAFNKLDDGAVLKANTPYVIKAMTENLELNLTDVTLYATEENTFTVQSAYDDFVFGGVYSEKSNAKWYTLNKDGGFQSMGNATLKPQRFWMSVTPRLDGPYAGNSASARSIIRMIVRGDDEVSGIESVNVGSLSSPTGIHNLQGQKVSALQSGHVYIMNGKKFIAK